MLLRLWGAAIIFISQAAIARLWGEKTLGLYALVFSIANIIAVLMPLGFQTIASYFVAEYGAKNQGQSIRKFALQALFHITTVFILLVVAAKLFLPDVQGPELSWQFYWPQIIIIALASALTFISGSVLVALRQPFWGNVPDTIIKPIIIASAFLAAWRFAKPSTSLDVMLALMATGFLLLALVQGYQALSRLLAVDTSLPFEKTETKRWWRFAFPWIIISLCADYFFDIELIALSFFLPHDQIAIFGVIARIFILASFGVGAVYSISLPEIFAIEAKKDPAKFLQKIRTTNLNALLLAAIFSTLIGVAAPIVLGVFGKNFTAGFWPLVLVSISLIIRTSFGPTALVLSIYNHPYAALPAVAMGMTTLLLANFVLVPTFGLIGASIACVLAITVWSTSLFLTCKKRTGLNVSVWP
jgi:O-antigen/teichoic acid export membrane protein